LRFQNVQQGGRDVRARGDMRRRQAKKIRRVGKGPGIQKPQPGGLVNLPQFRLAFEACKMVCIGGDEIGKPRMPAAGEKLFHHFRHAEIIAFQPKKIGCRHGGSFKVSR